MSDAFNILNPKAALRRLTRDMNMAEQSTHHAGFRYAEKAWIRTGKHLRRALEEYDQQETQTRDRHSK